MKKSELRQLIREVIQEGFSSTLILWADGVSKNNQYAATRRAKIKGKSSNAWNDQYVTNANHGYGSVFFIDAKDKEEALQYINDAKPYDRHDGSHFNNVYYYGDIAKTVLDKTTKLFHENKLNEDDLKVSTSKYSWGDLVVISKGNSWKAVLHPKEQRLIKKLDIGKSVVIQDEQLMYWKITNNGNGYNIQGFASTSPNYKGTFQLKESIIKESSNFDNVARPNRMEKPPKVSGLAKQYYRSFYIGDQLRDILVDKYGKTRGEKTFDGLLSLGNNAIYSVCTDIMNEKVKMFMDLGEKLPAHYFDANYYEVWMRWINNHGRAAKKANLKK